MFVLIGLLFVLIGIAGFQFAYMFYFDRLDRERKKHVRSLERGAARLANRLKHAEARITEQDALIQLHQMSSNAEDEAWADVLDEG